MTEANGTATAASDPALVCPECGLKFETAIGLGVHRAHKHGVKRAAAGGPAKGKRGKPRRRLDPDSPLSVAELFRALTREIESATGFQREVLSGFRTIAKSLRAVRALTIKTRKELLDIRRLIESAE